MILAPTALVLLTQVGTLVWFLASLQARYLSVLERLARIDKHIEDSCNVEMKDVNRRLTRMETLMEQVNQRVSWRISPPDD